MKQSYLFITVQPGREGYLECRVGPLRSRRPRYFARFALGKLTLPELIAAYYADLGFSSAEATQVMYAGKPNRPLALVVSQPTPDLHLYFVGLGVDAHSLERFVNGMDFTDADLEKIRGGKWPYRPVAVKLDVEVTVRQFGDQEHVTTARFRELDTSQYQKGRMVLCVQYGDQKLPTHYRKAVEVSLFWRPPFPSIQIQRKLESEVFTQVRVLLEADSSLMAHLNMLIHYLPDLSPESGTSWHLANWWIS